MSSTPTGSVSSKTGQKPKLQTHASSQSIRAKAASSAPDKGKGKDGAGQTGPAANLTGSSKTVYKALLESPSIVRWPTLPSHLQQTLLHTLLDQLIPISYPTPVSFRKPSRSGKKPRQKTEEELLNDQDDKALGTGMVVGLNACAKLLLPPGAVGGPPALDLGAAAGGKKRKRVDEDDQENDRRAPPPPPSAAADVEMSLPAGPAAREAPSATATEPGSAAPETLAVLFVCLQDIVPQQLVAHLPAMVAASNARAPAGSGTRVVCLPAGSEAVLAARIGVRRMGCLGILSSFPSTQHLLTLITLLPPPLTASHLTHLPPLAHVPAPSTAKPAPSSVNSRPTRSSDSPSRPKRGDPKHARPKTVTFSAPLLPNSPKRGGLISTQRPPATGSAASSGSAQFAPLSVKILKTTTPADPKGRKVARTEGVKAKRKEKKDAGVPKGRPAQGAVGAAAGREKKKMGDSERKPKNVGKVKEGKGRAKGKKGMAAAMKGGEGGQGNSEVQAMVVG